MTRKLFDLLIIVFLLWLAANISDPAGAFLELAASIRRMQ